MASNKKVAAYVLSGLGFAAGIGGIFYAHKKGYGGWGKLGMFILFAAPFNITASGLAYSALLEEKEKQGEVQ